MSTLPTRIRKEIGEGQLVQFWCRHLGLEVVAEAALGLGGAFLWACFVYDLWRWTEWERAWVLLLLCIPGLFYFLFHLLNWKHEIHVVTEYEYRAGGVYYKFTGFYNYAKKSIPISTNDPVPTSFEPTWAIVWRWLTGQKVRRTVITHQGKFVVENRLVPAQLEKAILNVAGSPPHKEIEEDLPLVQLSRELREIGNSGTMPPWKVQLLMQEMWDRRFLLGDGA